ncbi:Alpha/Beta hydrolase protein [Mucor mucedo]|uniref:Alpha/Beta hydrolase protein n=1 Tax=Mucor mucedo TaxID=29922 RepID=UPI00221EF010|nr:Alpha/Beta hydrolase protein [Mucor mucedo]KAI7892042.1 Alpha/Beta hydrolase protein [Mucor mucedo]
MTEIADKRNNLSIINSLPAVIPPTTRFNFIKNWWHRSEKTSSIAQARIIQRIYGALPDSTIGIPTFARVGRIPIDKEQVVSSRLAREVNTLYISQQPKQDTAFKFESEPGNLETVIQHDLKQDPSAHNLVMCHGYGAGLGFFFRNYQSLSQQPGWRLFSIDWLGMGNSSRPKWTLNKKSNQTWDEIVEHVEEHFVESLEDWRAKVGLEKMTLFGHSLGGYFATCYALKYPDRVEKLILVSPAGIPEDTAKIPVDKSPQETLVQEANEINASYQADAAAVENIAKQIDPPRRKMPSWATYLWDSNITPMSIVRMIGPFGPNLVHTYTSRRFAHLKESEQHDLYDYLYQITSSTGSGEFALAAILAPGAFARKPLFHRLADLKVPTVFIYGEQDWMDYRAAEKAKKFMKVPVKVIRIPEGGHHMYLDNPEVFNEAVRAEMN